MDRSLAGGEILSRLRRICLSFPESSETDSWGHPNFRAGRKIFAVLEEYRGELTIGFKCTLLEQEALLEDPRFFASPYVGDRGWVSLRVGSGRLPWKRIAAWLAGSYRLVALKRMLTALDSREQRSR